VNVKFNYCAGWTVLTSCEKIIIIKNFYKQLLWKTVYNMARGFGRNKAAPEISHISFVLFSHNFSVYCSNALAFCFHLGQLTVTQKNDTFHASIKPNFPSRCPQKPVTGPYSEPDKSSRHNIK